MPSIFRKGDTLEIKTKLNKVIILYSFVNRYMYTESKTSANVVCNKQISFTENDIHHFYGPFKNISLILNLSFINGGRKPENPGKSRLTIRKQNLAFPHVTRAKLEPNSEKPNGLRVNSPIH